MFDEQVERGGGGIFVHPHNQKRKVNELIAQIKVHLYELYTDFWLTITTFIFSTDET